MAESAVIADPHFRVGIVAGDGGTALWPSSAGRAPVKDYLQTGDTVPVAEAERSGTRHHVVPDDAPGVSREGAGLPRWILVPTR